MLGPKQKQAVLLIIISLFFFGFLHLLHRRVWIHFYYLQLAFIFLYTRIEDASYNEVYSRITITTLGKLFLSRAGKI